MKNLKSFEAKPPTEKSNIPVILIEAHHVIILRVKNPRYYFTSYYLLQSGPKNK